MSDGRGQLILVAGLGLAVTFVALALLLNTVIYAENLATRGADVGAGDAVAYQAAAESMGAGVIAHANEYNHSSYDAVVSRVQSDVAQWSGSAATYATLDSTSAAVSIVAVTNGTTIAQDDYRNFTNASRADDWTLATDVTGVRRFELNVTRGALHRGETDELDEASDLPWSSAFRVSASNATHSYDVFIYENESDNVVVAVVNATSELAGTCTARASNVTVDLTEGRVAGDQCDVLGFPGVTGSYDVTYDNAGNVEGVYQVVVDVTWNQIDSSHYDAFPADPYRVRAVYDVTLRVRVATPALSYRGNVTAAPTDGVGGPGVAA